MEREDIVDKPFDWDEQESDDDLIFDPAIDATLEAHRKKRTRDEAFSDDDDDNKPAMKRSSPNMSKQKKIKLG